MIETSRSPDGSVCLELAAEARANALSAAVVEALIEAVSRALERPPALLVLRGRGRSFCAGFDLQGLEQESDASLAWRFLRIEHLLQLVHGAPCATLALAHGPVAGAGADLFAACTRRIAAPDASFRFPGARFGVVLGTGRLMRLLGDRAQGVVLGQRSLDAGAALALGLADAVVAAEDWPAEVAALADAAGRVPAETRRRLVALRRRHDDEDMGQLAHSVLQPGLKDRMTGYWQEARVRGRPPPAAPEPA